MRNRLIAALLTLLAPVVSADEGMWLLTHPPTAAIKAAYGFEPSAEWLGRMQRAAVRFETGGSGSLVSANGLVMTNHHVGSDMLAKLSSPSRDLLSTGFLASSPEQELQCPDLELRVLISITDVTDRINSASSATDPAQAADARRRTIADIEAEAAKSTGLVCDVVTLYQGGMYQLYCYKSYTDVRLVFAPEQSIAFFGGDTDNFEFPRYNLDCCFFRVYENGRPASTPDHLSWSPDGAAENELIFIFGHPGSTRRALTAEHLTFMRDVDHPLRLANMWRGEIKLSEFAGRNATNALLAREDAFGVANGRKAYTGQLAGLHDSTTFGAKIRAQRQLRAAIDADPELSALTAGAFDQIAQAQQANATIFPRKYTLERIARCGVLSQAALHIVRLRDELPKPNNERLPEYSDAALDATYLSLYSPEPVHDELEAVRLGIALGFLVERFGADDAIAARLLAGRSPMDRARDLVAATSIKNPADRKKAVESPADAPGPATDPLLAFASDLDKALRRVTNAFEDSVEALETQAYSRIARAKFKLRGTSEYPDATFTLRLTYGKVTGLMDQGIQVPAFTTIGGTFSRYEDRKGQTGFTLPDSWLNARNTLALDTPFNFVCTADIIGGNSGSPVVNASGQVVGLVFDGNIHSLTGSFVYDAAKNRAVAVDSRGMLEALKTVYKADALIAELQGSPK